MEEMFTSFINFLISSYFIIARDNTIHCYHLHIIMELKI